MATVTSVGGTKGIDESGLVDLLRTGMLIKQQNQKDQEDRKSGNDDLIKAGLMSKTMRPSKDGEKADFTDSSGRGWSYDDSTLKSEHEQLNNQRKDAHWITINSNVERELQQQINAGNIDGKDLAAQNAYRNSRIAQYLGVGSDGKMSSDLKDDLSPEGQAWVDSMTAGPSGKSTTRAINPTGVTYSPQMFANNAASLAGVNQNVGQGMPTGAPGRGNPVGWTLQNPPYQSTGRGQAPLPQDAQNMQALMSILGMQGNAPPMINPQGVGPTQQQLGQ